MSMFDEIPPFRRYGQDYGPFAQDTEPGFALGGSRADIFPESEPAAATSSSGHPFKVIGSADTPDPEPETAYQSAQVCAGIVVDEVFSVSSQSLTPEVVALGASTKVWLSFLIEDYVLTSFEVATDDAWPGDAATFDEEGVQTSAWIKVGEVLTGALPAGASGFSFTLTVEEVETTYHFLQYLRTNLFMGLMTLDGTAAIFPLPFAG